MCLESLYRYLSLSSPLPQVYHEIDTRPCLFVSFFQFVLYIFHRRRKRLLDFQLLNKALHIFQIATLPKKCHQKGIFIAGQCIKHAQFKVIFQLHAAIRALERCDMEHAITTGTFGNHFCHCVHLYQ